MKPLKCNFLEKKSLIWCTESQRMGCDPELKNSCRVCTTSNLHRGACISWFGGPLLEVHQRALHALHSHSVKHLAGEGASRKLEWVLLLEDALKAFEALKQACMIASVLTFAEYTKPFLLETDTSKDRLRPVLFTEAGRWMVSPHQLW